MYAALFVPVGVFILNLLRCGHFIGNRKYMGNNTLAKTTNMGAFDAESYSCSHGYTVEILSIDPLAIYINNFISNEEIEHLLKLGYESPMVKISLHLLRKANCVIDRENSFSDSLVIGTESFTGVVDRTARSSQSASLPRSDIVTQCLAQRMKYFLGNVQHVEVEHLQIVKYVRGSDEFKTHYDWFDMPLNDTSYGPGKTAPIPSNRLGTIFAYLDDNCSRGETYFPNLPSVAATANGNKFAIAEGYGGLVIKPRRGNAIFFNNLHPNGSGDTRLAHAGLPIESGTKIGLNMWSRYFLDYPMIGSNEVPK